MQSPGGLTMWDDGSAAICRSPGFVFLRSYVGSTRMKHHLSWSNLWWQLYTYTYIYIYYIYIVCISMPIAPRTPPPISSVDHSLRGGNPVCHLWSPEGKSSTPTMVFTMVSEGCLVMFNINGGQDFPWFQYYHKSSWLLSIWLFLTIYKYTIPLIMLDYITIHFIG